MIEMCTVKARVREFQLGGRTLLASGTESMCYVLVGNLSIFCLCPETLWESEINGSSLVKEISGQPNVQGRNLGTACCF